MTPKIIIKYNRFLDPIFIEWVKAQRKYKNTTIPSQEDVLKQVKKYNKIWEKKGNTIIASIMSATGLSFRRNQITVHVVSVNPRSFSSPIVIKSRCDDVDFINTITHELIHCLFSDNFNKVNKHIPWNKHISVSDIGNDHVIIHALLKHIYLDVLKTPKNLKRNLSISKLPGNEGYAFAWDIVMSGSSDEIIKEFKKRLRDRK